jgi:hypothetical protein
MAKSTTDSNQQAGGASSSSAQPPAHAQGHDDSALQNVYVKAIENLETVFTNAMGQMLMNTTSTQQQLQVMADAATTQDVMLILGGAKGQSASNAPTGGVS